MFDLESLMERITAETSNGDDLEGCVGQLLRGALALYVDAVDDAPLVQALDKTISALGVATDPMVRDLGPEAVAIRTMLTTIRQGRTFARRQSQ